MIRPLCRSGLCFGIVSPSLIGQSKIENGEIYLHLPGVIVTENAGQVRYLLGDGLGSIRQAVDGTGAVVAYNAFDPRGNPVQEGSQPFGFTGEWWQDEIDLLHLRARWYAPYLNHSLAVMGTLWRVGQVRHVPTLVAAVLHDTIEDTETTPEEIETLFGAEVLALVQEVSDDKSLPKGVRKQLQIEHASQISAQANNKVPCHTPNDIPNRH